MPCRVEMPANEQIHSRFYRYRLLRGGGGIGLFILPVVLIVICVLLFMGGGSPVLPIIGLVIAVGYLIYLLYAKPLLLFRAKPGAALVTEVTIFTENGLTHSARSEEDLTQNNQSIPYSQLVKAVETRDDFYLFTSPAKAILIDKAYFTKGAPEELRAALRAALGGKFSSKG